MCVYAKRNTRNQANDQRGRSLVQKEEKRKYVYLVRRIESEVNGSRRCAFEVWKDGRDAWKRARERGCLGETEKKEKSQGGGARMSKYAGVCSPSEGVSLEEERYARG